MEESSIKSEIPIESKKKRVLSEKQLENLRKARELATLKRKEQGDITKKEKQLKEDLLKDKISKLDKIDSKLKNKKKETKKESSSESSSSSSSSSSSEEEIVKPKPKPRKKPTPRRTKEDILLDEAKKNIKDKIVNKIVANDEETRLKNLKAHLYREMHPYMATNPYL